MWLSQLPYRKQATSHARMPITREHPEPQKVSSSFVQFCFFVLSSHMFLQSTLFERSGSLDVNVLGRQTKMCSFPLLPHMLAWYFICLTVFNHHGTAEDAK